MSMLLILPGKNVQKLVDFIRPLEPEADIRIWPETGPVDDVEFIVTWNHPPGELGRYPNLKGIMSFGAGVDHILRDPHLPPAVPISRIKDTHLVQDLCEYLVGVVLQHKRHLNQYLQNQQNGVWKPTRYPRNMTVGILGLGQIGLEAALSFSRLNFTVMGWSRTAKAVDGIQTFTGEDGLEQVTAASDFLICLLPLTPATTRILNLNLFRKMKPAGFLINTGRGDHLNEGDLIQALDEGLLAGACLDVFQEEPLPENHPFWKHPGIQITPHISALTGIDSVVTQIIENYRRIRQNKQMINLIEKLRGY